MAEKPYLSIVVTSRNDNHGGDMTKRMRIFVKALIHQCNKFKLATELIMVEWNPIDGEPLLNEVLPTPTKKDYLIIRYIIVPPKIHQTFNFHEKLPLFQMIAKNVGIQRSHAPFILCSNIDLLFSNELFKILAEKQLKEGHYYRANRCDIPKTIEEEWSVDKMLDFSANNTVARLGKSPWYANFTDTTSFLFKYPIFIPLLKILSKLKGALISDLEAKIAEMDMDACGDFTLMSKQDWIAIQGYPELEIYSLHIDSMGLYAANAKNIKQVIFNYKACTYHISHSNGWEFDNAMDKLMFFTNKPILEWSAVHESGIELLKSGGTYNINKTTWGLADINLKEIIVPS